MTRIFSRRKRPIIEGIGQAMVFLSLVGAVLYGGGWYPDGVLWQAVTKASAVGFLVLFVLVTAQTTNHLILLLALMASVAGDILLAIPGENSFIRGLIAFFIAHIFYVGLFLKNRLPMEDVTGLRMRISTLFWAGAGLSAYFLYPALGGMLIPVIAYAIILALMATTAMMSRFPIRLVGGGAILFLLSDGVLGARTFLDFEFGGPLSVWIPYYLGQLFLALGIMLYDERPTNFGGYRFD